MKWECYRCGYVVEGENPPEEYPSCHYPLAFWLEWEEAKSSLDGPVSGFMQEMVAVGSVEMVSEVAMKMKDRKTTCVVVANKGVPLGIVTEKDMVKKVLAVGLPPNSVTIQKIMSFPAVTIDAKEPARRALQIMKLNGFHRLIMTDSGKPAGIVTQESILEGAMNSETKGGPVR